LIETRTTPATWNSTSRDCLYDPETGHEYQRIVGGVGFPVSEPGFACLLGQALHPNPQTKLRDISILTEIRRDSAHELFAGIEDLHWRYGSPKWFGDTTDEARMILLHQWNKTKTEKRKIRLTNAPGVELPGSFQTGLRMIRDAIKSHRKVLQFKGSTLRDELTNMGPDPNPVPAKYPAMAALAYALMALQVYEQSGVRFKDVGYMALDDVVGI